VVGSLCVATVAGQGNGYHDISSVVDCSCVKLETSLHLQVAGFKFLRLYSRKDTPCLYVECGQGTKPALNATRAQKNISAVNVEDPDLAQHPKFAEAKQLECILGPGDMLFIPAKYWHYVRSLSPAVSINFWY